MGQEEVFQLIRDERQFQKDSGRSDNHTIIVWASIAHEYAEAARSMAATGHRNSALVALRSVAAVCVAAIEQYGAPERDRGSE